MINLGCGATMPFRVSPSPAPLPVVNENDRTVPIEPAIVMCGHLPQSCTQLVTISGLGDSPKSHRQKASSTDDIQL